MATVYRARDPQRREDVALKILHEELAAHPSAVKKFMDEAQRASLIDHPNVIRIHEVGVQEGRPFLVCELAAGETLRQRIVRDPLDEATTVALLRQLVCGLIAVHECGIIHGDLKPANVILTTDEARFGVRLAGEEEAFKAKIVDFGIARVAAALNRPARGAKDAKPRMRSGTPRYMAPELTLGDGPSLRSDIYSLGVIAFEAMSGRTPFPDLSRSDVIGNAEARRDREPDRLEDVSRKPASEALGRVVAKMLAFDPTERYDPEGLLRDMERLIERETPESPVPTAPDKTSAFRKTPSRVVGPKKRRSATGRLSSGLKSSSLRAGGKSSSLRAGGKSGRRTARPGERPFNRRPSDQVPLVEADTNDADTTTDQPALEAPRPASKRHPRVVRRKPLGRRFR